MGINEMDFQWRLNWWYRPTQLDGFGTSVADYYAYFCDWKADMELNECPAHEVDYVAAFIQNLKCDIQSRLPKYVYSGGLICAFLAAKVEESMMRVEEALKNIGNSQADQPQVSSEPARSSSLPTSSSDSCLNEIVADNSSVIEDNEFSILENDESLNSEGSTSINNDFSAQIEVEKETHKLFDGFSEPILDEVLGIVDYDSQTGTSNQDIDDSESQSFALEALSWLFEEDEHSPPSKLEGMGNAHHSLDESPTEHSLDQTKGYPWGPVLHGREVGQSHLLTVRSVNYGRHLIDKMPQLVLTSLQSIPEDSKSLFLGEGCSSATYKVFDEMPRLFFVALKEKINGDMDSITQIDCFPRVFDPGISISFKDVRAAVIEKKSLHNELSQPSITSATGLKSNSGQCHSFDTFLGQCKLVPSYTSTHMVFIFDPGGCGELFGFWIEGVVGTLYCRLLKCVVRCPWSHIISLVDEMKRASIGNKECCKLFCLINGVAGSSWLSNGCDRINKRSNAFDSRDARQNHNHFPANQGAIFLRGKMLDSAVCWPSDLRYEAGALGDISTKISHNSKFELYDNSWVVVMSILVFDPGGSSYLTRQYKQKISGLLIMVKRNVEIERVALEMLASQSNFGSTFFLWFWAYDCYTFIIIVEYFVWDPGTTFVVVPCTSLRTMMLLKGMERMLQLEVNDRWKKKVVLAFETTFQDDMEMMIWKNFRRTKM